LKNSKLDCDSAKISIPFIYSKISNLSVISTTGKKISSINTIPKNSLSFSFSPLLKDVEEKFIISFIVENQTEAFYEAQSRANLLLNLSNQTQIKDLIQKAEILAKLNKTEEALFLLDKATQEALVFSSEKSQYNSLSQSLDEMTKKSQEILSQLPESQKIDFLKYYDKLIQQSTLSEEYYAAGEYAKASSNLRKGISDFRSNIASFAWNLLDKANELYSKSKNKNQFSQFLIKKGSEEFSNGQILESILSLSLAIDKLSQNQSENYDWASLESDYSKLKIELEDLIFNFTWQYNSLSAQSKRKLPLTPSEAQKSFSSEKKSFENLILKKDEKSFLAANKSLSSLLSLKKSISESLDSIKSSANSTLQVAKIAVSEIKSKIQDENLVKEVEEELTKSQELFSNGLYADSLVKSDKIISTANSLLSSNKKESPDLKVVFLGIVSVLFLILIAYYFWSSSKEKKEPKKIIKNEKEQEE
jgi:tetratricopeptide (TPR) repeat protein